MTHQHLGRKRRKRRAFFNLATERWQGTANYFRNIVQSTTILYTSTMAYRWVVISRYKHIFGDLNRPLQERSNARVDGLWKLRKFVGNRKKSLFLILDVGCYCRDMIFICVALDPLQTLMVLPRMSILIHLSNIWAARNVDVPSSRQRLRQDEQKDDGKKCHDAGKSKNLMEFSCFKKLLVVHPLSQTPSFQHSKLKVTMFHHW